MNESPESGPERVAVTLADVVAWATEFADDPAWRLPDLIAELDSSAKDQAIGQLFRLVYYALLKPSQLSDSEYLERIVLLSRDLSAPLEGDVWAGDQR